MRIHRFVITLVLFGSTFNVLAASHKNGALTPIHSTTKRSAYTIETIGDSLHQAKPENTRIIIRVSGADKKLIKPYGFINAQCL